jgi:hypothetical protein
VAQGGLRVVELHLRLYEFERRRHDGGRYADRGAGEQYARVKAEFALNEEMVRGTKEKENPSKGWQWTRRVKITERNSDGDGKWQEIPKKYTRIKRCTAYVIEPVTRASSTPTTRRALA